MPSNDYIAPVRLPALRFAISALLLSSLATLTACESQAERIAHQDRELIIDGFMEKPANTPERQAMLSRLPVNRLVRQSDGDRVLYVLADPAVCNCIYVGNQSAFNNYGVDRQLVILYPSHVAKWNWSAWTPLTQGSGIGTPAAVGD
jgi:hypothetical protein